VRRFTEADAYRILFSQPEVLLYSPEAGDAAVAVAPFMLYSALSTSSASISLRSIIKRLYLREFRRVHGDPLAQNRSIKRADPSTPGQAQDREKAMLASTASGLELLSRPPSVAAKAGGVLSEPEDKDGDLMLMGMGEDIVDVTVR
jgi:hypothetical protein